MNQQQMMRLKKMQKQMMEAQEKLESSVFTGTAGGGVVTVEVKGNHEVLSVTIDPEAAQDETEYQLQVKQDLCVHLLQHQMKIQRMRLR